MGPINSSIPPDSGNSIIVTHEQLYFDITLVSFNNSIAHCLHKNP